MWTAPGTQGWHSAHLPPARRSRQRELAGQNGRGACPSGAEAASAQLTVGPPFFPCFPPQEISGQMPTALSHPCQPHTRPAHCHLISAPKLGPVWQPADSILSWLLFSLGTVGVCAGLWCLVGSPPLPGVQSGPLSTLLTCSPSGKGGQRRREGGSRKRLLPEREETWELGNGKGRGPPLPPHAFLPLLLRQPTPGIGTNRDFALPH